MTDKIIAYTDAPVDYDWRWCRTLVDNFAIYDKDRPRPRVLRKIELDDEFHADSQLGRYGSGMHIALFETQFNEWVEAGLIEVNPVENQVVHYRDSFEIPENYQPDLSDKFMVLYEHYAYGEGKEQAVVKCDGFGGGSRTMTVYVKGDENVFNKVVADLKSALESVV